MDGTNDRTLIPYYVPSTGETVLVDDTAAKGAARIDYTLKGGQIVTAWRAPHTTYTRPAQAELNTWSGSPCPIDPDNCWTDDETGEHVSAITGRRTPGHPEPEIIREQSALDRTPAQRRQATDRATLELLTPFNARELAIIGATLHTYATQVARAERMTSGDISRETSELFELAQKADAAAMPWRVTREIANQNQNR